MEDLPAPGRHLGPARAVKTCWPSGSRCTERPRPNGTAPSETNHTPMSACLYVEMTDGTTVVLASGKEWKAKLNAQAGLV